MSTGIPELSRPRAWAARLRPAHAVHGSIFLAAVGLWIVALRATDLDDMRGLGLIDAFPPAYYGALLLALAGCLVAVLRRTALVAAFTLHLATLIVVLHGTTALLYETPRYPWVYKHLGVIDYIRVTGGVDRTLDIYNNWPGLFALTAMISDATGLSPMEMAPWAQVFFSGLTAAAALFAIRPIVADQRQRLLATLIVVIGDWVGQNYLAPQALAFPLMLVAIGLWLRIAPEAPRGRLGRLADATRYRLRGVCAIAVRGPRPGRGPSDPPLTPPLRRRAALVLGAPVVLAIVLTHQLSPIVLITSTLLLALTTQRRLGRLLTSMIAVQLVWLALAWPYLADRIRLFEFGGVPRPEIPVTTTPLPNAMLTARAAQLAVLVLVLLAVVGAVRRLRAGRPTAAALTLVVSPLLLVPVQSYGGEAGLRAYLFSLPWLAALASDALMGLAGTARAAVAGRSPLRTARRVAGMGAVAAISAIVLMLAAVAYFGAELASRVGPEDVEASVWYENHAPGGSILAYLAPGFPNRVTAHYADHEVPAGSFSPSLTDDNYTRSRLLDDSRRVDAVIGLMEALPLTDRYLVIGPSQIRTLTLFGVLPADVMQRLPGELRAAPQFEVVYDRGGTTIFRYRDEDA